MTSDHLHNVSTDAWSDSRITRLIEEALLEDLGMGDITTEAIIPPDATGHAHLLAKEPGIVAGIEVAGLVFHVADESIAFRPRITDGGSASAPMVLAAISGSLHGILKAERTALNFLQRMSGIATLTSSFVDAVHGTSARITDTRKTAPGLRILDKLAVQLGGGVNHRFGLDDMVLIKDNHIAAAGGIGPAIERCLSHLKQKSHAVKIEIETRNLADVEEALKYPGIHRIMLDNFSVEEMRRAVERINGRVEVEASGNVTLDRVRSIAETGVDYISVGALTHSVKALDISLDVIV